MSRHWSAKADANQPDIVKEFRRLGAYVFHVHRLKNCCDLVVLYQCAVVMVEVKMPGKPLTAGEAGEAELDSLMSWSLML